MVKLVKNYLERMLDMAHELFYRDGYCVPVFFLNRKNKMDIVAPSIGDNNDKDALFKWLLQMIKNGDLTEFAFLSESWVASGTKALDHLHSGNSLENYQDRIEAITVLYSSPEEEICYVSKIERKGEKATLGPWECTIASPVTIPTRFGHLWQRAKVGDN